MSEEFVPVMIRKKDYKRMMRNFSKGKGCILKQDAVKADSEGAGFGDFVKSVGKSVGKTILNEGIKQGARAIKKNVVSKAPMGLNVVGDALVDLAADESKKKVSGMGFMDMAKSAMKSKVGKQLQTLAVNEGAKFAKQKMGNSVIGNAVVDVGSAVAKQQIKGQGLRGHYLKAYLDSIGHTSNQMDASHGGSYKF
jgi:hypothetical protein